MKSGKIYIEANWQLFGLVVDLLKLEKTKIIIIFRDPRDWVRSWMNKGKGSWYDKKDLLSKINCLGFKRVDPSNVGINNPHWKYYSRFQKLCWVWHYMNNNFYEILQNGNENITYFLFENLFVKKDVDKINELLKFALNDYYKIECLKNMNDILDVKINESEVKNFLEWNHWTNQQCKELHHLCGGLMQKLGYGKEKEWSEKIDIKNN